MPPAIPSGAEHSIGRLEAVALREVWSHEAHDFTPWLLAHADTLGNELDMDLEFTEAEHPVGDFSLDLKGRDLRSGELVLIENQLEATDHSHLGQLLTYAGGAATGEPVNLVWIAKRFRDEHRAAIDWLNTRTDPDTRFFGVEVRAVRIDGSRPAPLFRAAATPNDWGKAVRAQVRGGEASEKALLYGEFWEQFIDAMNGAGLAWSKARKPPQQNWFPMPSGVGGITYCVSFRREGVLSEVFFEHPDPHVNTDRFERLNAMRTELEAAYGGGLAFEPLPSRKGCRIGEYGPGDVFERERWSALIDWFIDTQRRLRQALGGTELFDR